MYGHVVDGAERLTAVQETKPSVNWVVEKEKKKKKKKGRRCHSETPKTLWVHSTVSYNMSDDVPDENVDTDPWRNRYVIDAADYATLTGRFTEVNFGNYSDDTVALHL